MGLRGERVLPAFTGWPRTRVYYNKKHRVYGYRVFIRELTPLRAKIVDALGTLTSIAVCGYGIKCVIDYVPEGQRWPWGVVVVVGSIVSWPVTKWLWELMLRKRLVISYDRVRLTRKILRTIVYDANYVDGFSLDEVKPRAQDEAAKHETKIATAAARREIVRPKKYYQNAAMLLIGYHGEGRTVMPIYRIHRAQRIVERLQAIHRKIIAQASSRAYGPEGAETENPAAGWSAPVNSIP
jgi:hypothetical protein